MTDNPITLAMVATYLGLMLWCLSVSVSAKHRPPCQHVAGHAVQAEACR